MDEAIRILQGYAEYQWRWVPWNAVLFVIGVIAALLVKFCKRFKVKEPWKVYFFALVTTIVFLTTTFGSAIPASRDAKEENIYVLEGVYLGIDASSDKGSRSPVIEIALIDGTVAGRYLAPSFTAKGLSYNPRTYFPEDGPLRARIYCAGRTNRALYMDVIE